MSLDPLKRFVVRHPRLVILAGLALLLTVGAVDPVAARPGGPGVVTPNGVYIGP